MKVLCQGVSRLWMQFVVYVDWCPFNCVLCEITLIREMERSLLCRKHGAQDQLFHATGAVPNSCHVMSTTVCFVSSLLYVELQIV